MKTSQDPSERYDDFDRFEESFFCCGLLGIINIYKHLFLVLVSDVDEVCEIFGSPIYNITGIRFVEIQKDEYENCDDLKDVEEYKQELEKVININNKLRDFN